MKLKEKSVRLKKMNTKNGFTLIELLVTIVIIGILVAIGVNVYENYKERARLAKARAAAYQMELFFRAENTLLEGSAVAAQYSFDNDDVNTSASPYVLDNSAAGNHLDSLLGAGSFSQSSDTGTGKGSSIRIQGKNIYKNGTIGLAPVNKFTMGFWVKLDTFGDPHTPLVYFTDNAGFLIRSDGSVAVYMNDDHMDEARSDAGIIDLNSWHYIVGGYGDDDETLRLWVDGDLVAKREGIAQSVNFNGTGLRIGYPTTYGTRAFYGWLDNVFVVPSKFDGEGFEYSAD